MRFCSDLDNTLIYSARRAIGSEKVCVEWYQGREASFMTRFSWEKLSCLLSSVNFVPVTTRTREQYGRIHFPKEPEFALVCNGGVLLKQGAVDEDWYRESLIRVAPFSEEKERLRRFLEEDGNRMMEVRDIEGLFLFTKSECPELTAAGMRETLETPENWILAVNGSKVYALPKVLEKGAALVRFREKYGPDRTVAAGDSSFDRSLLAEADVAIAPEGLMSSERGKIGGKLVEVSSGEILSDRIWEWVDSPYIEV